MTSKKNRKKQKTVLNLEEKRALEKMNRFRITSTTKVPEEVCVFKVQGVGCMALGDLSAVKAEPKNGKTTALKWICSVALGGKLGPLSSDLKDPQIMWVDTEQKMADAKLVIDDIKKITRLSNRYLDKHITLYALRKTDSKEMLEEVLVAIKANQPEIVIIDGIADFVNSVNDEAEARLLIRQLMEASETYFCSIICVLHENRSSKEMKGHLGAQLTQKVGTVIGCKKNGNVITVSCTDSRHQDAPRWSIQFDGNGNIVDANGCTSPIQRNARPSNQPNRRQLANEQEKQNRLTFCRNAIQEKGGRIAKKELITSLMAAKNLSRPTASNLISSFVEEEMLFVDGKIITTTATENVAS